MCRIVLSFIHCVIGSGDFACRRAIRCLSLFVPLVLLLSGKIEAQTPQSLVTLPAATSGVSVVDGHLYCYSDGLRFAVRRINGNVVALEGDTLWSRLDEDVNYVVRNPRTGNIFFTTLSKNQSELYECVRRPGKDDKVRRIKLKGARGISIEHPVFTRDGMTMVFSAADRMGLGGKDIWYSRYDTIEDEWTMPRNMGHRVNTAGEEIAPSFCGDFLFFTSRMRAEGDTVWSVYATKWMTNVVDSDTVTASNIGRAKVQKMPYPFNALQDDYEMIRDSATTYWLSRRNGYDELYAYDGRIDGVLLKGKVLGTDGNVLSDAVLRLTDASGMQQSTTTDASGNYQFLLNPEKQYSIMCFKQGFFEQALSVETQRLDEELLVAVMQRDVTLESLPIGEDFYYQGLFASSASADLSAQGRSNMARLADFLRCNPQIRATISLRSVSVNDLVFAELITDQRIESLKAYFRQYAPTSDIRFENDNTNELGFVSDKKRSEIGVMLRQK